MGDPKEPRTYTSSRLRICTSPLGQKKKKPASSSGTLGSRNAGETARRVVADPWRDPTEGEIWGLFSSSARGHPTCGRVGREPWLRARRSHRPTDGCSALYAKSRASNAFPLNRTVFGAKLGRGGDDEFRAMIESGIHSRERGGPDHVIYFVSDLSGRDARARG